ncbi:SmdA family multidrug ABC transporter permease/ATP-binding protein [Buchnera aphidicola (Mindarus keteleerifoliae)]|uniref:SmdA family multidrug ABC transporter permease/ATP-binding protein n=1 Tax=Buchnera aphidicola TaxID=9 RepID=UPI0031B715C5
MIFFKQLSWYFIREWKRYLGAIFLLIIIAFLQLLPPKLVGMLVDLIIQKKIENKTIFYWVSIILIAAVIIYILRYMWRVLLFGAAYKLAIELREKLFSYFSKQNQDFFLKYRTGDLIARATNDVDRIVFASGEGILTLVDSLVMGCLVIIVMISQISWLLTIISLLPMPIMAIIIKKYGEKLHKSFYKAQTSFSLLNNQTQESLTSIRMLKSFGLEKNQSKKFNLIAKDAGEKNMEVAKIDALFDPTIHLTIAASNLLAIIEGGWLAWQNKITLGELTTFIMYLGLMVWPMLALAWMFNIVERGSAAWERIEKIIKFNNKTENSKKKRLPLTPGILNVKIKNYFYPHNTKSSIKNISFFVEPGKKLGLCGPTGCGKSTLLNLIQYNFTNLRGDIFFNGVSLSEINLNEWRARLSVVNQTTFLFSDTIKNNISLGTPNANFKNIEYVSSIACIHKDIIRLPQGYETQVGEKGIMLSGGQKQRIAIARALLTNREILILDDSLSAIDGYTSKKILSNLNVWKKKNKTMIISSHKLSIVSDSDEIIVMNKGSIIQKGTHIELIKNNKWYNETYYDQRSLEELDKKY